MTAAKDGGPAFPLAPKEYNIGSAESPQKTACFNEGMSLRDYFAATALQGYIAAYAHPNASATPERHKAARDAYEYADAMLQARAGGSSGKGP